MVESSHPIPDKTSLLASQRLLVAGSDADIALADLNLPEWLQLLVADGEEQTLPDNSNVTVSIIACLRDARKAAAAKARELSYGVKVSHAHISADAVNAGRRLALELTDSTPDVFAWGANCLFAVCAGAWWPQSALSAIGCNLLAAFVIAPCLRAVPGFDLPIFLSRIYVAWVLER